MSSVTPFQNYHLVWFHIESIVVRRKPVPISACLSRRPCSVQVMLKCYNYTGLQECLCVFSHLNVCLRACLCARAETGPIDLLRAAAAVVMVTEEEDSRTLDLLSLETKVLTEYRTHTHTGWRTAHECITTHIHSTEHKVTDRPMFCYRLHLNRNTRQIWRTSQSRMFEADGRIGGWTGIF